LPKRYLGKIEIRSYLHGVNVNLGWYCEGGGEFEEDLGGLYGIQ